MKKICPKCNMEFECTELSTCWCMKLPKISFDEIDFDDCMCKNCLMKAIQNKV
jgi:hypothetical protein